MKFEIEIPKQTRVTLQKPCHLILKPEDPICLPGGHFESGIKFIGFYPYTQVMCYCILDLIFKAKLKLESWNQKKSNLESDIAENQQASAYGCNQHAHEIWNWNSKANLTYAPETMSHTDRCRLRQYPKLASGKKNKQEKRNSNFCSVKASYDSIWGFFFLNTDTYFVGPLGILSLCTGNI